MVGQIGQMRGVGALGRRYAMIGTGDVEPASLAPPPVTASYVNVYDATNDWPLYAKADTTLTAANQGASTTKLATGLVVLNAVAAGTVTLAETVTVLANELVAGTNAGLQAGDVISIEDLLYGLILPSGNDAAEALARHVGDAIAAAAGSGSTGRARFVAEMNALAASLGMSSTTYESPHGVQFNPSGVNTDENITTAADLTRLGVAAFGNATFRAISGTASRTTTVTGANARSITVHHTSDLVNETAGPSGIGDDGILGSKSGSDGFGAFTLISYWNSPAGRKIVITTIASTADAHRFLDQRAIYYQLCSDFPYLAADPGTDAQAANVRLLVGANGSIVDESSVGRTLTVTGPVINTDRPMVGAGDILFDGVNDFIQSPDSADLSFGASDFALELFMRGDGAEPTGFEALVSKYDTTTNQREWSLQYDPGTNSFRLFFSRDGVEFPVAIFDLDQGSIGAAEFFNGGMRHIAARREGAEIALYVNGLKGFDPYNIGANALFNGTAPLKIGARSAGAGSEFFFGGKLDEIRLTVGNGRYTGDKFTPSVLAHPRS